MFITKERLYTNSDIKREAKAQLSGRWKNVLLLFLVPFLLTLLFTVGLEFVSDILGGGTVVVEITSLLGLILGALLQLGAVFALLDVIRNEDYTISPLNDAFQAFRNGNFGPYALIYILKRVYTFLWGLLFIIPGIVKSYSYSQAEFLRRDYKAMGREITSNEAITLSRELMDGHKADLFALYLSFIGWYLLSILTFGLLLIYVIPYQQMSRTVFYQNISREHFAELERT